MATTLEYDRLVEKKLAEREARGNIVSTKFNSEVECAKEVSETTEGVFTETLASLDITQADLQAAFKPIVQPKRRGRPPGSRNRPKNA